MDDYNFLGCETGENQIFDLKASKIKYDTWYLVFF